VAPGLERPSAAAARSRKACLRLLVPVMLGALLVPRAAWPQSASPLPGLQNAGAWRALEEHRYGDAAGLFEAAVTTQPHDAALWFGAGVAALMRGVNGPARIAFEQSLAIDPTLIDAAVLLGQSFYRDGQVGAAIEAYEQALAQAPNHPELVDALSRWRQEVTTEAPFLVLPGEHFDIRYFASDEELAHRVLDVLEAARARLAEELAVSTLRRVEAVLYSPEQFKAVTKLPDWAVGIYDGRIKVPLGGTSASADDLERVLEHELVHAMVATIAGPTVPAWLNEGLATALERDGAEWAEELAAANPSFNRAELPRGFRNLMPAEARDAYATSTRAVQRLLERYGSEGIARLLRRIGFGLPFPEAFHDTVGTTFEAFVSGLP
jgi:tetratricopeptide (TPR) repeat protein